MSHKFRHCEMLYTDSIHNLSTVERLPDGSLFTLASTPKASIGSKAPKTQMAFGRRSFDGGRTWTDPSPLFAFPDREADNLLSGFLISKADYIHAFVLRIRSVDFGNVKNNIGDIWHLRFDNADGDNPLFQKLDCLDRYSGSLNNLIQLSSGRLVVPFSTIGDCEGSTFISSTVYSDDEGLIWKASNDVLVVSDEKHLESGAVEPVVVETEPDTLVMIIRTVLNRFYHSISRDGGAAWSESRPTRIPSSNAPAVPLLLPGGRIFLSWNDCLGHPMHGTRYSFSRQCLHGAVSDDGLRTLKGCRMIMKKEPGDPDGVLNCYPFASLAGEKELFLRPFTVNGRLGETWNEPQGVLLRMNPDFLEENSVKDDLSDGGEAWVTNGREESEAGVVIRVAENSPGYACTDFPYGKAGSLSVNCRAAGPLKVLLSDCYLDVGNFKKNETTDKYREVFGQPYLLFELPEGGVKHGFTVEWKDGEATLTAGELTLTASMEGVCPGLNHIILMQDGGEGELAISSFEASITEAGLDTGICY